jgi:hypothetical protein
VKLVPFLAPIYTTPFFTSVTFILKMKISKLDDLQ